MKFNLNLTLAQKAILLVCVPLMFEIAFVAILGHLLQQAEKEREMEAHAKDVQSQVNNILSTIIDAGAGLVISEFAKSKKVKERYGLTADRAKAEYRRLVQLVKGHPDEEKGIQRIGDLNLDIARVLKHAREDSEDDNKLGLVRDFGNLQSLMVDFSAATGEITAQQKSIEKARSRARMRARGQITGALYVGLLFNITLAVGLALYFNRGTASRMIILLDNTKRLARGAELNPPIGGNDEIAHLDKTFNEMAAALALASRKERAIIANARDVIFSLDKQMLFSAVNPASTQVWGYAPDELKGKDLASIVAEDEIESLKANLIRIAEGESSLPIESRVVRKEGDEIEMLWSVQFSKQEDTYFCVAHDITERKQIERMKREFVAMVSHDLRTPLTSIQGFLNLLEAGAYGELTDAGADSLSVADTSITRLIKLINDLLDVERLESGKFDLQLSNVDVEELFEQTADAVETFAQQQGVRILIEPDLSQFPNMIHPIANSSTSAIADPSAENANSGGASSEPAASAASTTAVVNMEPAASAASVTAVVNTELAASAASAAGVVNTESAAAAAAPAATPAANNEVITYSPATSIFADGDRLIQVLVNLLSNAIKFSPSGSKVILASADMEDCVEFKVIDEGRGIPSEFLDSVFERFKQVKKSDAKNKKGTGLGLAISKAIVEKHGGTIGVRSQEGKGSTFWFRIPKKLSL